ncbi:MAG: D-tyrosyl-tRNA(Tyr) deacylase, partial [Flavobacteriaceae bacterium]|nr:D-tyrosyl-tRNA(Tyr) deacylase [Flavobacteriaceae bacterium]
MKTILQRVEHASVLVNGKIVSKISNGILILLGITDEDTKEDVVWLSKKITNLRIFDDENSVMNKSLIDINGDAIIVSQFTLMASTKKGNRPSYIKAAKPEIAIPIYNDFVQQFENDLGKKVGT